PASQAYGFLSGSGVQRSQHLEQDLFQARLQRGRAIAMYLLDRSGGIARSAEAFGHIVGEHRAQLGRLVGIAPGHLRSGAMVFEIVETQSEADSAVCAYNLAELVQISGLAVGSQPHDLVFITKFAKSQVLRHSGVIHAKRVRKCDGPVDVHAVPGPGSPHGAGKIAKPVRGQERSLVKWRNEKRARQMRLVMLDAMILGANFFWGDIEGLRQRFRNSYKTSHHFRPL